MAITPEEAKKIQDAFGTPVLAKVDYSGVPTVDTQKKLDPTELKSQWAKLPYDARDEMMRKAMKNGDTYILGSYPQDERDWQKFSGLKLEDSFIKNTPKFQDTTLSQGRVIDKKAIEDQLQNEKDPLRRAELETTLELAPKELDPYAQIMKAEDAIKTNERLAQKKANEYANGVDYLVRMRANTPTEGPTNVFNEFYKGFARASQQAGGAVFGALEMLSENDPYMTWLNDYAQTQADNARSSILKSPELNRSSSTKNFTDGGYADPNYYANVLGSLLPHIAGALTASVAGASVGGGVGAVAGASAYSFSMESGSLYNDLLDSGYSMDEARSASLKYGAVASVLDSIIPAKVGGAVANTFTQGLLRQGVKQSVKQTIGKMVKEFGKDVLIEASTEATQEFAQNVTKRYFDKNQDIWENVVDSFVGGALGGGVFGAVGMGTQSVDNKTATVPEEMRNYSAENGYQGKDMQNMASQKVTPDVSNRLSSIVKSATTNESAKKGFSQLTEVEDGISASIRLAEIMKAKDPTDKVVQDIQDQAQQELNKVKVQKQILAKQYEEGTNVDVVASPEFTMSVGETIDGKFISSADLMLETGTEMLDNPTKYDTRAEAELGMTNLVQEYIGDKLSNEEMDQVDIERLQSVNSTLLGFVQKPNPQRMIRENRDVMLLAQDMKDYGRFEKAVRSNNLLPEGTDLAKFYERAQSKEGMYVTAREARGVVEKYAKDMGVSTEFVDRITTPEGKQALGSFMRDKRVIKLVTRGEEGMPDVEITTPYHEVGHAYFQTMMTPQERADVLQEIKNSRKKEMTDKQAEEILVEDLRAYNDKKTLKALKKTIQPAYARLLDSIKEIVDKVLKWVSRSSEDKINQFYEDVLSMKRPSEKVAMERAGKEEVYRETPEDLSNEALKYDTVEAFIEDVFSSPSYGMGHRPAWEDMPPASNLLEGGIIPSDVYEKPEWSIASGRNMRTDAAAKESFSALLQVRDKPEMEVTIYRSSPKNELHIGDWVSLSKTYAKEEGSAENSPVFSYKVKAKDVIFAGDDINEFGYYPKQMLVDIYNKAHEGENKQIFDTMVEKNTSFREEWRDGHSSPSASFDSVEDRMNDGGDFSLKEVAKGFHTQPKDYFDEKVGARYYMYNDKEGMESATVINNVQRRVISGKENITVKAYRAIPNYIQNTSLINYDWVSLSKSYAINHGESRFGDGEYHIIEQDVAIENLWWDGNDIREWGYDTTTQEEFDAESFREAPSSLEEEAKKYKSAEEFANAQIKNYHGTKDNFDVFDTTKTKGAGFYFTRDKEAASSFAKQSGGNIVKENYIFLKNPAPKDAVIEAFSSANAKGKDFKEMTTSVSKQVRDNLTSKGYDGYYGEALPSGNGYAETVVFDPSSIKTKQQLTDIYNKAHSESIKTESKPSKEVNDFSFNQNEFDAINEKIANAKSDAKNAEDAFYNNNRKPDEKSFTNNDFIEKTLATEKKGGWLSNMLQPAKNLPQDFQDALGNWKREKLLGQNRANTEAYSMKDSLAPIASKESILSKVMNNETSIGNAGKKFIEFMQNPTKEAAKKSGINFEESKKITDKFGGMFDNLRDEAITRGLDFGYIENYIPQLWKDAPQKIQEVFAKSASSKPFFSKERILEDYNLGIKMGLTPKYSHPAQLLGEYIKKMEDSLANKKLVDTLVENKYIAPTDIANMDEVGKSWKIVEVPGLPSGGFKAPPEIQKVLHNIFGVTEKSDVLQVGANVAGFMQKAKLTGGVGTVNGFTVGQAFKEMALGMAHPIDTIKNIVTGKGTGLMNAFTRGISKDASQKYFIDPVNSSAVKELSSNNIELNSPLDYKTMFQNAFEKNKGTSIKDKLLGSAKYSVQKVMDVVNHSDNDTFQQFMPILQVEFYKKAKDRLLKQGMSAEDAVRTASEQTKNFYGSVNYDLLGRSKNVQNALSTLFFAPRFREGILNVFYNTAKSLSTELKNKSFAENRRLAAGVAITYGLYNALNYQLNGKPMWDNQSGWEGDLVVPQEDGTVIRIPFMPSFMTMPRNAFGVAKNLLSGDTKKAAHSASGFMSMPIQMSSQIINNEDYFGNPIYTEQVGTNRKGETNTTFDKYKDQALYIGSGFTNSYLNSAIDYGRGKKTGWQAVSAALELPVKYGKQKDQALEKGFETYINYIGLKNDIERLQKDNKDGSKKGEIDAKIQEMKDQAGSLSEQDKLTYQGYRSGKLQPQGSDYDTMIQAKYGSTTVKGEATAAAQPVYDNLLKIKELSKDSQGNKEEIVRLFTDTKKAFDALSPYEKKNGFKYLLNKKAKTIEDKKKMIELSKKLFGYDDSQE